MPTPEELAREKIDALLKAAGWSVFDKKDFAKAVYVLHAFQKKSPKGIATDRRDVATIARRLKAAQDDYRRRFGTEGA